MPLNSEKRIVTLVDQSPALIPDIEHAPRAGWGDFPQVIVANTIAAVKRNAAYSAAKTGDIGGAVRLVDETLTGVTVDRIVAALKGRAAILQPVHAVEAEGINRIPAVMAEALEERIRSRLTVHVGTEIVQTNSVGHTGASGWQRIANPATFDGGVEKGAVYVLLDDFVGQGGTLANLRGHIRANGGEVLVAATLTGEPYSAKLAPSTATLAALRVKHGAPLEKWFRDTFGFGFERLTESKARYLTRAESVDVVRNRIAQARFEANR